MKKNAFGVEAKINLERIINDTVSKFLAVRELGADGKPHPYIKRDEARFGNSVKVELREHGGKQDSKKVSLNTMNSYLTKVRKAIVATGLKHHLFDKQVTRLIKSYPLHEKDLRAFFTMDIPTADKYRKDLIMRLLERARDGENSKSCKSLAEKLRKVEIVPVIIQAMSLSALDKAERVEVITKNLKAKKGNQIRIQPRVIKNMIIDLLTSEDPHELAVGVSLATGRRSIETIIQGTFARVDDYRLTFKGQAKDRGRTPAYKIPTLAPVPLILNALEKLRDSARVKNLVKVMDEPSERYTRNELFNHHSRGFNQTARNVFERYMGDKNDGVWTFKDTRAIYARLSFHAFQRDAIEKNLPMKDDGDFYTEVLGHTDATAKENYKVFYIVDDFSPVTVEDFEAKVETVKTDVETRVARRLRMIKTLSSHKLVKDEKALVKLSEKLVDFIQANPNATIDSKFLRATVKGKTIHHKPFLTVLNELDLVSI